MKRFLSLYLPHWSTDLWWRRRRGALWHKSARPPLVLTHAIRHEATVMRVSPEGVARGVREGMSLSLAQAMVPTLTHAPLDTVPDIRFLLRAGESLQQRIAPLVALDGEILRAHRTDTLATISPLAHGLAINLSGTDRLFPSGYDAALKSLEPFYRHGISARAVVAPTYGAAWALTRYGITSTDTYTIHVVTDLRSEVRDLPVAALRLDQETCQLLSEVGITSIGQLLALPRHQLGSRCGVATLLRIEHLLGEREEILPTLTPPTTIGSERRYETPLTTHSQMVQSIVRILETVLAKLHAVRRTARAFRITLHYRTLIERVRNTITKEVALLSAGRDVRKLASLLTPLIEKLVFPGEVEKISIVAVDPYRTEARQSGITNDQSRIPDEERYEELLATLAVRVGYERTRHPTFADEHLPEKESTTTAATTLPSPLPTPLMAPAERPHHLLSPPQPIEVVALLPDHPPAALTWNGKRYRLSVGYGPERIERSWWEPGTEEETRDYFRVQDEGGRWLWIYRHHDRGQWFVHGTWS